MGCIPSLSQELEIPGSVSPLEGEGEAAYGVCLSCVNGGGSVPCLRCDSSSGRLVSPCPTVYPQVTGSLGPQQQEYHWLHCKAKSWDRTRTLGMVHLPGESVTTEGG